MSNVLVTGGQVFRKPYLFISTRKGHNVISFDSYINSYSNSLDKVKSYFQNSKNKLENNLFITKGDLRNFNDIDSLFFDFKKKRN